MPDYRRLRIPGATYFFTVNLLDRRSDLLAHIAELREAVRAVRAKWPFHIDAWVVLPEHMHCLWTMPEDDSDFPRRWQEIKISFAKSLPKIEPRSARMVRRRERGFGNAATGNTRFATTAITQSIWTMFTSIR
jgi:putative transposase